MIRKYLRNIMFRDIFLDIGEFKYENRLKISLSDVVYGLELFGF